jgi:hypothetical protein
MHISIVLDLVPCCHLLRKILISRHIIDVEQILNLLQEVYVVQDFTQNH